MMAGELSRPAGRWAPPLGGPPAAAAATADQFYWTPSPRRVSCGSCGPAQLPTCAPSTWPPSATLWQSLVRRAAGVPPQLALPRCAVLAVLPHLPYGGSPPNVPATLRRPCYAAPPALRRFSTKRAPSTSAPCLRQPPLRRRRCCPSFETTSTWTKRSCRQQALPPWQAPFVSRVAAMLTWFASLSARSVGLGRAL